MSTTVGVVEFFVIEATEYVEGLDMLLGGAEETAPDAEEFLRRARSLRGSATMAKQYPIARVAAALEKAARAMRDGTLRWDPAVRAVFISTVENLRILMRNIRAWSPADELRAQARSAELERLAPGLGRQTPVAAGGAFSFLASETATLADTVEQLIANPRDREALTAVLAQARTLRGIATLRDLPPLPDVVDAVERVARSFELGASASARQLSLCSAGAGALRRVSGEMASGRRIDLASPEIARFTAAMRALVEESTESERVVPIAELYFDDDGPHVIVAAVSPPRMPLERLRLEVVGHAENIRRLVSEARAARDPGTTERIAAELRAALGRLERTATSFGERSVSKFVTQWTRRMFAMDAAALTALERATESLTSSAARAEELLEGLRGLESAEVPSAPSTRLRFKTPHGQALFDLLEQGIARLSTLGDHPLSEPVPLPQDEIVPIEELLYRGPSALRRAFELRHEIRRSGTPPPEAAVFELLDVLDLAVAQ